MNTALSLEHLEEAKKLLKRVDALLQFPIGATPTGKLRNVICDAHIHTGEALANVCNALVMHPKE